MAQAFLNRQKIYKARQVDRDRLGLAGWQELSSQLQKIGRPGIDWALDEGEVMPYKGLLYAASRPRADGEEQSAESILLSSGDVQDRAVPVDTESRVFQILDFKGQTVCRVYYDHNKAGEIEPILDRSGVKDER